MLLAEPNGTARLRVVSDDDSFPEFDRWELNLTLPQLWTTTIKPAIVKREDDPDAFLKGNERYYRVALNGWRQAMGDMPLGAIDADALSEWRSKIKQRPGRDGATCSPNTVRRHWRYLSAMLRVLYDARIIDRVPRLKMPKAIAEPGRVPVALTDTWSQLARGCTAWQLTKDHRIPGPLVGRGVLVWLYSTGLRTKNLFALDRADVRTDPHCPEQRLAHLRNPHGWLATLNTKANKPVLIPLTEPARRWFDITAEMLPPHQRHHGQLLPVGSPQSDTRDAHRRQDMRQYIHAAAGLKHCVFTFHQLRGAANEAWNAAEEDAGDWLLGHAASRNVNTKHYRSGVTRLLRAVEKLQIPEAFQQLH